jgi:hypothetical protein
MASVYNRIDRGIGEHHNHAYRDIASLLRVRMQQSVRGQWYRYDYRNAAGTSIDRALAHQFELTPIEIETLINRYVIPLADLPILSKALGLDSEALGADKLSDSLEHGWMQLRDGVVAPLEQAPKLQALVQLGMGPWRRTAPLGGGGDALDELELEADEGELAAGEVDGEPSDDPDDASPTVEPVPGSSEQPTSEVAPVPDRGGAGRVGGVMPGVGHGVADPMFRLLDRLRVTGNDRVSPVEDPATVP